MSILIKNAQIWNGGQILPSQNLLIENGKIAKIDSLPMKAQRTIDAEEGLLIPGFVDAHTHLPMSLMRGSGEDMPLQKWLTERIFPLEAKLDDEAAYYGTMLSLIELARSGTTGLIDMYFFSEAIARAVEKSGMRALLSRCITGGSVAEAQERMKEADALIAKWNEKPGRIRFSHALHAEYTCAPEVIGAVAERARRDALPIQILVSETKREH